jgi:hypothetical protein
MSKLRQMEARYGIKRSGSGVYLPNTPGGVLVMKTQLHAVHIRQRRGIIVRDDRGLLSERVITTAGVTFLATAFVNTVEPELINFHAAGTGTTAEAIGDTALVTEVESRATGTQSNPSAGVYRSVGTVSFTATRTIAEHGILTASSAGTLWDRSVFSGSTIGVVSGDSIQFTYNLTLSSGG